MDSDGSAFYRGVLVRRFAKLLPIFKFRAMLVEAKYFGGLSTADDDPRITKVGKFLRRYKMDELPQIINLFLSDMSFVGLRAQVTYAMELYTEEEMALL